MEIVLPPKLLKFVEEKVQSGQFPAATDVIVGALESMKDQEELTAEDVAELREEVAIGLEQLARGDCAEWDVEQTKAALRERAGRAKGAS
jgi:putative addiction module CopG family antidote